MLSITDKALSITMVFAPSIGYIDQYGIVYKNKTSLGFNSVTCAILCFANILRLFFWLGKRFDVTLLFQSITMLITMLFLLHIVIYYKPKNLIRHASIDSTEQQQQQQQQQDYNKKWYTRFWNWDNYLDYINCLLLFTSLLGVAYVFLHSYDTFIETLGFLSLGLESTLPLPQLLTNFKHRNTDGFSLLILASWFLGDGFKAFYFFYTKSPIQFVICALIQLTLDTLLVFQLILFTPRMKKILGISNPIALAEVDE